MGESEFQFVKESFKNTWNAPHVEEFEKDIARFLGGKNHVAALSSGTAALHLALLILRVGPGDEVICQSMTFSASANPIRYLGATPVFVESEERSWNMSADFLEEAIQERIKKGKKPKAIIAVHLYGMPADMDRIVEVAKRYEIPVIEDAAEALGSAFKGKALGTMGDLGVLSFNSNKIITTTGGGALISEKEEWIRKAKFLANQARDEAPFYQHSEIGYNYRLSKICAGIGRGQMEVLPLRIQQRRKNFEYYKKALSNFKGISFLEEPDSDYFSNRWLSTLVFREEVGKAVNREKVRIALERENIESRPLWKPMHMQPVFAGFPFYGDGYAEQLFEKGLCLPSGSNLSDEDLGRVVQAIKGCFQ